MTAPKQGAASSDVEVLLEKWGLPLEEDLLITALTHRSFANEIGGLENNERLEFLGDSVLGLIATEELYSRYADSPESELASLRASTVSRDPLARIARRLHLGEYILLGVGENKTGGREKDSILADTVEALIGATYLTHGLDKTRRLLLEHLEPVLADAPRPKAVLDWKTPLREVLNAKRPDQVTFKVEGHGPDHNKHYVASVYLDGQFLGEGTGPSKKRAENAAAEDAYHKHERRSGAGTP